MLVFNVLVLCNSTYIVKHVFQNLIEFFFIRVHGDVCTKTMTIVGKLVSLFIIVIGGHQQVKRGDKINIEFVHLFSSVNISVYVKIGDYQW